MTSADSAMLDRLVPAGPSDPERLRATNWLLSHGLPAANDEAWKYSPVKEIIARLDVAEPAHEADVARPDIDRLAGDHGGVRLVLVNGVYVASLSDIDERPPGVAIGASGELTPAPRPARTDDGFDDGFQALNRAAAGDPAVVVVDASRGAHDGTTPTPIHIVHVTVPGAGSEISHPRSVIDIGDGAHVHLIETYTGLPGSAMTNADTEIRLGQHAVLTHDRIQSEATGATHIGHTRVVQLAESRYDATSIMVGADIARHAIDVVLSEPHAHTALTGLYHPIGDQRHDTTVCVDHAASHGSSTQLFKGVIDDHARGSFSGRIIVRPGTVATDAHQNNHNLVLQPSAQADTRPWLEIFADDVRCTHGATVGRLDDDALFYLRSRGISVAESRAMLIDAFIGEVVATLEPASLREHLEATMQTIAEKGHP